jgi:hypothetical protein
LQIFHNTVSLVLLSKWRIMPCKIVLPAPARLHRPLPCRPDDTAETAVLHRSCEVQPLISNTPLSHLRCMTGRQKCEFGSGQLRAHDFEKRQALVPIKLESSLEWFANLQCTVACKMNKPVVAEAIDNCGRCRSFRDETCHLGIESLDDLDLVTDASSPCLCLSPHCSSGARRPPPASRCPQHARRCCFPSARASATRGRWSVRF